jgi:hypothetical protein
MGFHSAAMTALSDKPLRRGEERADTASELIHLFGSDPLVGRLLDELKNLDTAGVPRGSGDDMNMKVVEALLLGNKQHVRLGYLEFGLEGLGQSWNEPAEHGRLVAS